MRGEIMTRILVLEDNKDSLNALQSMIEKVSADIFVTAVKNRQEAEKALEAEETYHTFLLHTQIKVLSFLNKSINFNDLL